MLLVGIAELTGEGHFVDCLVHADHLAGRTSDRQGQNVAGTVAGTLIYVFIEALILIGIVNNQRLSVVGNIPGNTLIQSDFYTVDSVGNLAPQNLTLMVYQPDSAAVGGDKITPHVGQHDQELFNIPLICYLIDITKYCS